MECISRFPTVALYQIFCTNKFSQRIESSSLTPSVDFSYQTPTFRLFQTYHHQQAHQHEDQLEVHGWMLLLKKRMLIYIALIVSGSLHRRMGRPPVCCIDISNNVCNCSKNEHTFLSRQNKQLNCVSYLATLTFCKSWRAHPVCNSSRTNCFGSVFALVFI